MQDKEERIRKRYKSSDESSFNTRESGDGNFNLNITTGDEEDERPVQRSKGRENDIVIADQKAGAGLKAVELEIRRLENRRDVVVDDMEIACRVGAYNMLDESVKTDLQDGLLPMTDCMPYGGVQSQVVEQPVGSFNPLTISSKSNKVCGKRKLVTVYSNELSMGYLCVHLPALREPQSSNEGGVTSADIQDKGYKGNFDLRLPVAGRGGQLLEVERGIFDVKGMGPDNVPGGPEDGEDDPKDSTGYTLALGQGC
ncbi:hypothetical protein Tco_1501059 [Tanacetum coccineum]